MMLQYTKKISIVTIPSFHCFSISPNNKVQATFVKSCTPKVGK